MTKPDDIDQDAWDTGARMAGEYLSWLHAGNSAGHLSEHAVSAMADTIARAIMSARAEEREACAKIADDREAICADAVAKVEAGELYQGIPTAAATESCARLEAAHIARLIRNRP
jgi:hypothetical protein